MIQFNWRQALFNKKVFGTKKLPSAPILYLSVSKTEVCFVNRKIQELFKDSTLSYKLL